MHDRGRRQHRINHRQRIGNHQTPPRFGDLFVHDEDSGRVFGSKPGDPDLQLLRGSFVPTPDGIDSAPYLSDGENAQERLFTSRDLEPGRYPRVASPALAQLGDHVRIDEVAQRATFRPVSRGRSKSRSSPTSGISSRNALNEAASPPPCKACFRISRCSASADRPCCAARTFRSLTSLSSMLRTMSWATFLFPI